MAMLCHLLALAGFVFTIPGGNIIGPLILWAIKKDSMPFVNDQGKEAAVQEGIAIAREMLAHVREHVQGVQVSAPFGRVPLALQVFQDVEGIDVSASVSPG